MQTTTEQETRNYTFVGIKDTLAALSKIECCDIDAKDEAIAELETALLKITTLSERGYLFNERTAALLAAKGELDLLKFCVEELACPVQEEAFSRAAEGGHLDCVKYLENYKHNPLDAIYKSVAAGHLHIVKYIFRQGKYVPDIEKLRFYQEKGGFPEIQTYLSDMYGMKV